MNVVLDVQIFLDHDCTMKEIFLVNWFTVVFLTVIAKIIAIDMVNN